MVHVLQNDCQHSWQFLFQSYVRVLTAFLMLQSPGFAENDASLSICASFDFTSWLFKMRPSKSL